jgi:hypothetical protein
MKIWKGGGVMLTRSESKEQIVLKGYKIFIINGALSIALAIFFGAFTFGFFYYTEEYTFTDVFGLISVCALVASLLALGIYAILNASRQITLTADGILSKSLFGRRYMKWSDVRDFGLSYSCKTRWMGNTYYLYFSENELAAQNECSKNLKGKLIYIHVIGKDYSEAVSKVVPFCKDKTDVIPFSGSDKYHFG